MRYVMRYEIRLYIGVMFHVYCFEPHTCIVILIEGFCALEMHLLLLLLFQLAEVVFFEHVMFAAVDFLFIAKIMNVTCCVPSTGALAEQF